MKLEYVRLTFTIASAICWIGTGACMQPGVAGTQSNASEAAAGASSKAAPKNTGAADAGKGATAKNSTSTMSANAPASDMTQAAGAAGTSGAAEASGAAAASGAAGAAAAMAGKPKNPNAIPACEAKNNEGACEGSKLYYCIDEAPDGAGKTCMSAALCQAGIKSGKCGVCEPGTFQCMTTELQKCDESGQWQLQETCASADLCKESKGICDTQVCTAGEYHCDSSTDALQICNDALTAFETEKPCEKGLCNEAGKKCNECDPMIAKACDSERQLTTCSPDGVKKTDSCPTATPYCVADKKDCFECVTDKDCGMATSECGTRACKDNKCVDGDPKPLRTPCNGSNVCDGAGSCVACIVDSDCKDSQLRCLTGVACVSKNPIEAALLVGSYSVNVNPGYDVEVDYGGLPVSGIPRTIKSGTQTQTFFVSVPGQDVAGCTLTVLIGSVVSLSFGKAADSSMPFGECIPAPGQVTLTATAH